MMKEIAQRSLKMSALLAAFCVLGTGIVAVAFNETKEQISANEALALLTQLNGLVPPNQHDNEFATDTLIVTDQSMLGTDKPVKVYRARLQGEPTAAIFETVAPDGYSGSIKLLVAIDYDGIIAGVRVVSHKETPGLGDYIEHTRTNWIFGFDGRSLSNPVNDRWKVRKDGGDFDHISGATITPRAVVKAVYRTLQYFANHRDQVFSTPQRKDES
jgi:electron transport complex protein RnfG